MKELLINLISFMALSPVVYVGGVAFTASSFSWMRSMVNEYSTKSEWPYIIIILVNGMVPTILTASDYPLLAKINPAYIILITPIFAILEFALLSRDMVRTYLIFAGMIVLQFACFFGVGATIITAIHISDSIISDSVIRSATMTFSQYLLSLSLFIYNLNSKRYADILKKLIHDWSAGLSIFLYMITNGLILGIAIGFDYNIYFSDPSLNPYRKATIIGMLLRYSLILITSYMLVFVQCRMEINRRKAEQFEIASHTDPLTGLLNRAGMDKKMSDLESKYLGTDNTFHGALFILDMDHFKDVNDNLGHPVGDELLKNASKKLSSLFRDTDYVCRLGGDEFCIFYNGPATLDIINKKASLINETIRFSYPLEDGTKINTTTSVGIAYMPNHGSSYRSLYQYADKALYEAKNNGRDCYVIAK